MRKRSIGCDILIGLLDCKLHTIQELAERAEVSYSTVFRYIQDLSISLPIETEHGRQGKRGGGGVRLLNKVFIERLFTAEEIRYIRNRVGKTGTDRRNNSDKGENREAV